jgi:hypothetical protein
MPPTTPQERAWVSGIVKLRQRIDRVMLPSMTLTHAKLEDLSDVSRTCRPGLAKLGQPSQRLRPAHQRALSACRDYERAGRAYRSMHPYLDTYSPRIEDALNEAAEHEGNGSNGMREAEAIAREVLP